MRVFSGEVCKEELHLIAIHKNHKRQVIGLGSLSFPISHWSRFTSKGRNSPELLHFTTSQPTDGPQEILSYVLPDGISSKSEIVGQ